MNSANNVDEIYCLSERLTVKCCKFQVAQTKAFVCHIKYLNPETIKVKPNAFEAQYL